MDLYINENEKLLCDQLRERVSDLKITDDAYNSDWNYIRFLKARNNDLDKAEDMFRKWVAWRKENDMDNAPNWNDVPQDLKAIRPYRITGYGPGLVSYVNMRAWDPSILKGRYEDIIKVVYHEVEIITNFSKYVTLQNNCMAKMIVIANCEGLTVGHVTSVDVIRATITLLKGFEAYYPETLYAVFVINAPWAFFILWSIAKPFVSNGTLQRVKFLGNNPDTWKEEISKCIPEDQIPMSIGGLFPDDRELVFEDGKVQMRQFFEIRNQPENDTSNLGPECKVHVESKNALILDQGNTYKAGP